MRKSSTISLAREHCHRDAIRHHTGFHVRSLQPARPRMSRSRVFGACANSRIYSRYSPSRSGHLHLNRPSDQLSLCTPAAILPSNMVEYRAFGPLAHSRSSRKNVLEGLGTPFTCGGSLVRDTT
jgi:hypothetical protein